MSYKTKLIIHQYIRPALTNLLSFAAIYQLARLFNFFINFYVVIYEDPDILPKAFIDEVFEFVLLDANEIAVYQG